ncbi:unnamed protein product [Victoria cruziana]
MVQIVMLPFLAQGHFTPFLALADAILHHHPSHAITIATTPFNVPKLRSKLPPSTPIRLVALDFDPAAHGLPPDGDSTDVLPYPLICRLLYASRSLLPSLEKLIGVLSDGDEPLCLIADIFFGWTVGLARERGIFHAVFITCSAFGGVSYISVWRHLPHMKADSDEFALLPDFPDIRLHRTQISDIAQEATGSDPWSVYLGEELAMAVGTDGVLVNTMEAIEPEGVDRLNTIFPGRPIWCIGPALPSFFLSANPSKTEARQRKEPNVSPEDCAEWLHLHPPGSVLYVSFGSQNTISASRMKTLAMGLEESGMAFIWVVRPPLGFEMQEFRSSEWLPEGFEERMRENMRGLVVRNWAPQLTILAHESTGAFLSHCGWNSVLESLSHGVPLIGWPLAAEQFSNSKMMEEEMGVAVELARGRQAEMRKEDVVRVVGLVMGETEKRVEMRRKAGEARDALRGAWRKKVDGENGVTATGPSLSELNDFISTVSTKTMN